MAAALRAGLSSSLCCCAARSHNELSSTSASCSVPHTAAAASGSTNGSSAFSLRLGFSRREQQHTRATRKGQYAGGWEKRERDGVHRLAAEAAMAVAAGMEPLTDNAENQKPDGVKTLLEVKGLTAAIADGGKEILKGVDLVIREGEVHAIMGRNGSGKSTLSKVLVGHPDYEVTGGTVVYKGQDLFEMEPEERSHAGLFLSFQSPVEIPGVSNTDFLRMACNARRAARGLPELDPLEFYAFLTPKLEELNMNISYLQRNVNEGFSGGEKKRNEILQLAVLEADMAILDEIDSGLDIDALRDVASAVKALRSSTNAVLMITHYQRLLDYIEPDFVHIMEAGKIVKTGDKSLAKELEVGGYASLKN